MKILILNGNQNEKEKLFDDYLEKVISKCQRDGHEVECISLRNKNLQSCIGCMDCWFVSPGRCILKDDGMKIISKYLNSDFVLMSSPLEVGFPTSLLKRFEERLVPTISPYLELVNNEYQNISRVLKNKKTTPKIGLVIRKESDTEESDLKILYSIYKRFGVSFKSKFYFLKTTEEKPEEIAHAIINN